MSCSSLSSGGSVAVADAPETRTFYRALTNNGDNRLLTHGIDRGTFPVTVGRLDEDLAGLDERIDLLKMDIQGAEPLALAGSARTLAERPPNRMLIEFWPHGIVGMGGNPRALIRTIREAGYRITAMGEDVELDVDAALRDLTVENEKWIHLACIHATAEEGR